MTTQEESRTASTAVGEPPSRAAGLFQGIGLGGFVDGIVLHQILQWHHMLSDVQAYPVTTVAGLEVNTMADGFFHVAAWLFIVAAAIVTIAQWRQGGCLRAGSSISAACSSGGAPSTSSRASSTIRSSASTTSEMTWAGRCPGTSASWSSRSS